MFLLSNAHSLFAAGTIACMAIVITPAPTAGASKTDVAAVFAEAFAIGRYVGMPFSAVSTFTENAFSANILGERTLLPEVRVEACFGDGTDHPALTPAEVGVEVRAILASYSAAEAAVQDAAVKGFETATKGLTFSGCRLAAEQNPWSRNYGTFFIARESDTRIGFEYGWAE